MQIRVGIARFLELIGFIKLVRNWYAALLLRFSPFATRDTEVEIETRGGLRYVLRPKRGEISILNEVLYHNIYARQFPVKGVVVDIGAHIGVFTVYAGTVSDRVICYEPHRDNYELLERNVLLNSLANVVPFQQAVGDSARVRELSLHATKSYAHTFYPQDGHNEAETVAVETITLGDIFSSNQLEHVDFLKMHCECAELGILTHEPHAVLSKIDTIAIKHSGCNDTELVAFLQHNN
ncbi:MAG: FkbM family methyltransferase, partial [Euryarchaeota archaeon]|nr:FkbM family methyltransferase [Euryarchaeota archaeon]